jgi:hypothetical protein
MSAFNLRSRLYISEFGRFSTKEIAPCRSSLSTFLIRMSFDARSLYATMGSKYPVFALPIMLCPTVFLTRNSISLTLLIHSQLSEPAIKSLT